MGVRADGTKELIAMADGYRESSESWASLLRDCQRRGMRAPILSVGDGVLGLWKALNEVLPETRPQRCWIHKTANCLDSLPKSAQPAAKKAIQDICNAEDKEHAAAAVKLRTKVTKVTKGAGSRAAALAMVFKLVESAQARWRAVNAPHLVALVRAGARFEGGRLVERPQATAA